MKAAVIGSGIGGLAIAIRLAVKGYLVTVYEKNPQSGGKIAEIRDKGYRFDTGPSLFTLPGLTEELFELSGKNMEDYFQYSRLDLICSYFYEDGLSLQAYGDPVQFASEIENKTGEPARTVLRHLKKCREQYELTADIFLFRSLRKIRNYFNWKVLKGILLFYKVDAFTTMHQRNSKRFTDKKVIQLFDRYATYNGSNPFVAPATLNVISHLEHNLGAYFPSEGMHSLARALELLARDLSVEFHFSNKVENIIIENKKATGLTVKEGFVPYDLIVSDVDVHYFYKHLMPGQKPLKLNDENLSSSAMIFYWGIKGINSSLGLHNILFSDNYREEFRHIFEHKSIYSDPTIYIYISSRLIPSDAPEDSENWFVMINVPPDTGQDWNQMISQTRTKIIDKINRMLKIRVDSLIDSEQIGTPETIEKNTASWKGALYGDSSNSRYAAFLRHPFRQKTMENVYFVGGSVHPGGGIPLCLASARIVDQEIKPLPLSQEKNKYQ